jgi:Tol biopolymer transport system component
MRRALAPAAAATVLLAAVAVTGPAGAKVPGPNGQIVFTRTDRAAEEDFTYTINPDGSNMQPLLTAFQSAGPHWSPNSSEVAVGAPLPVSAVIVDPDTGSFRTLPQQDPNVSTFCVVWSPDATHLACDGEGVSDPTLNGLYTIRSSDGGGLRRLTNAEGLVDIPIDYSPDRTRILFGRVDPDNHHCTKRSALFVVNVDGSGLDRITPWGFCDDDGSWSPDGTEIAFEHNGSMFVVHPNGSDLAKVPLAIPGGSGAGDFVWSPDGTKIVFLLFARTGPNSYQEGIATANADGTNVQQVTIAPDGMFDHEPDWGSTRSQPS